MDNKIANDVLFHSIIGEQLSSVCFVQDYLQLDFDGFKLTTYTTPVIMAQKLQIAKYTDGHYKNELCEFIAKKVSEIKYEENDFIEIFFADYKKTIRIIINPAHDNVYYTDIDNKWFIV